jgi:hypothetical protein
MNIAFLYFPNSPIPLTIESDDLNDILFKINATLVTYRKSLEISPIEKSNVLVHLYPEYLNPVMCAV